MLTAMHEASKNWLGKIVLGFLFALLILSFAVWGIGDIFRGFGSGTVAKAGDIEIPTEEYRAEYQTLLQNYQRNAKRVITNDQARALGIDKLVLNRMISEGLIEAEAKKFGLAMNSKVVARVVLDDPRFKTPSGAFNRIAFQRALSDAGLNETRFLNKQRSAYLRAHLVESFADKVPVSNAMLGILHQLATETRSVEYFTLGAANAGKIADPGDTELQTYFKSRKASYRAPEYRKIVTLAVKPLSVVKADQIPDADARKEYDRVKARRFATPEKRDLQQIIFKPGEESAARAALDKIRAGSKFADIAKERKLKETDIALGLLEKGKISDPEIAKAAFSTDAGKVSEVVKSRFGPAIVHVVKVEAKSVKPFDAVKEELKRELAAEKAKTEIRKLYEKIEDARTSGKVLEEAAKSAGLKVRTITAVNKSGLNKKGLPVKDLPEKKQFLEAVFASDIGVDNDTLTITGGGHIWFEVAAIDPARDRKLEEVKDRVKAAWRAEQVRKKLREIADKAVTDINGGKTLADVAKELGVTVELAPDVLRRPHSKLAQTVVNRIFSLAVGKAGTAPASNIARTVFKVEDSNTPPLVDKARDLERIETQISAAYKEELAQQYVASLRKGLSVTINPTSMRNVVGGEANR